MPGRRQHGEGSVYKRTGRNGRPDQWVAVVDLGWKGDKRDRREFTSTISIQAALDRRDAFLRLHREGFTLPKGRPPYVSEWVGYWLNVISQNRAYRQKCRDYIIPYFAKVRLPDLTMEDIEVWHQWMARRKSRRGGTLSASTIGTTHHILSASLNVAVARRRIPHNPCRFATPPAAETPPPEPPTAAELELILDACREWPNGARWVLACTTGLRQGEALGLRWRDVQLTGSASVSVRQALARVDGRSVLKTPKSAKSRRSVPLPAVTVAALKAHREAQQVRDFGGLVFTDEAGRPVLAKADWKDWQALLASAGIRPYRIHDARHSFATTLLEEGADPRVVQDLMGWSTAKMAEVYQHVRPVMHEHARSLLDRRFGS